MIPFHKHKNTIGGAAGLALLALAFGYRWFGPSDESTGAVKPKFDATAAIQRALEPKSESETAPPVGPSPEPAPPAKAPVEEAKAPTGPSLSQVSEEVLAEVDSALASAQKALKAGQLIAPPKDNALYWYDAALELDPANKLAHEARRKLIRDNARELFKI